MRIDMCADMCVDMCARMCVHTRVHTFALPAGRSATHQRRFSVIASAQATASTREIAVEHWPREALGGGDAWIGQLKIALI